MDSCEGRAAIPILCQSDHLLEWYLLLIFPIVVLCAESCVRVVSHLSLLVSRPFPAVLVYRCFMPIEFRLSCRRPLLVKLVHSPL